jgi:hypothetical protein
MYKTAYVAGSVRGKLGDKATYKDKLINIDKWISRVKLLRLEYPNVVFYSAHEWEMNVTGSYNNGLCTSQDIINQCLAIVSLCDIFICGDNPKDSDGISQELDLAKKLNKFIIPLYLAKNDYWDMLKCKHKDA